jgi:hypothetical protein
MTRLKLNFLALAAAFTFCLTPAIPTVAAVAATKARASHTHKRPKKHHHNTIPQHNGGDHDGDNNGGPSDGDGNI